METLQEAFTKNKELAAEKSKIVDLLLNSKSKQEVKEYQNQFNELCKQQEEIYKEINRLSNGNIQINKKGTKITVRQGKQ